MLIASVIEFLLERRIILIGSSSPVTYNYSNKNADHNFSEIYNVFFTSSELFGLPILLHPIEKETLDTAKIFS